MLIHKDTASGSEDACYILINIIYVYKYGHLFLCLYINTARNSNQDYIKIFWPPLSVRPLRTGFAR